MMGHMGEDATKKAASELNMVITTKPEVCEHCATGKAKQKAVPQVTQGEPLKQGERRMFLDLASVKKKKGQPNVYKSHWRMMIDEKSGRKYSQFFKKKSEMVEPTCVMLKALADSGKAMTHLRMDNAGENKSLQERCTSADWQLSIAKHEYTARDTPQQNSPVEVGFTTILKRA